VNSTTHQANYGNESITFQLERKNRKTLAITVHPDGRVSVTAPQDAPLDVIHQKVEKRADWIVKQQRNFNNYPPPLPERQYVSGETYRYLGRQYRLKVVAGPSERMRLWRGRIEVHTSNTSDNNRIKKLLTTWLRQRAHHVFQERYQHCNKLAKEHGISHGDGFRLLHMPKRWGSCTKKGKLLLNPALVGAPKECIDYVIIHELIHTLEHNHGPLFYKTLEAALPNWKHLRAKLNTNVEPIKL
jgi:predicted metal-dependent hydrolase